MKSLWKKYISLNKSRCDNNDINNIKRTEAIVQSSFVKKLNRLCKRINQIIEKQIQYQLNLPRCVNTVIKFSKSDKTENE